MSLSPGHGHGWTWMCCKQTTKRRRWFRLCALSRETGSFSSGSYLTDWRDRKSFHRECSLLHSTLEKPDRSINAVPQITGGWPRISPSMLPAHHRDHLFLCFYDLLDFSGPHFWCQTLLLSQMWLFRKSTVTCLRRRSDQKTWHSRGQRQAMCLIVWFKKLVG